MGTAKTLTKHCLRQRVQVESDLDAFRPSCATRHDGDRTPLCTNREVSGTKFMTTGSTRRRRCPNSSRK
jgi:hypothetical protein